MANRIGFKEFLKKLKEKEKLELVLDANVIIASRDTNHRDHKRVREFFNELDNITENVDLFTTVTTKSEFLEYYRRKILTEGILDLLKKNRDDQVLSDKAKIEIEKQIRARNLRQIKEIQKQDKIEKLLESQEVDTTELEIEEFSIDANYFKDSEIKDIKKAFRARDVGKEMGWISFCSLVLLDKLHTLEKLLDDLCHYLTTRDEVSKKYFIKQDVEWRMATQICGETGVGYSDAMILNMANHTNIKNIVTLDFDLIYGGHFSADQKLIITPTERLKNYKLILK